MAARRRKRRSAEEASPEVPAASADEGSPLDLVDQLATEPAPELVAVEVERAPKPEPEREEQERPERAGFYVAEGKCIYVAGRHYRSGDQVDRRRVSGATFDSLYEKGVIVFR